MKKIFTYLLVLMSFTFIARTQDVVLLSGETTPEPIVYYDFVEWSIAEGKMAEWYVDFGTQQYTQWVDNPDKTGINKTEKALYLDAKASIDWWGNFLNFRLETPITITEDNRYLHIYHWRENLNDGWMVGVNLNEPADNSLEVRGDNAQAGRWEDIVVDLKPLIDAGTPFEKFYVLVDKDWNGPRDNPPTKYYFDEIILSADPFPRGVEFLTGTDFLNFQDEAQLEALTISPQNETNTFEVVDNPFPDSEVNNTSKVGKFFKSNTASWWQGLHVQFPGVHMIEYGERQYLHVFVKADKEVNIQLHIIDHADNQFTEMFLYPMEDIDGEWFDLVWDLSSYTAIKALTIRFDVQVDNDGNYINETPEGTFYVDEIVLDDNAYERESTVSVRQNLGLQQIRAYSNNNTIYFSMDNAAEVHVFDLMGRAVAAKRLNSGSDLHSLSVPNSGLYILRARDVNGNVSKVKVLVK